MDTQKIKKLISELLVAIGENVRREGLKDTPNRVAKSLEKVLGGYEKDPKKLITIFDNEGYEEMIIAKEIDFCSFCEHHLLPFYGKVWIGYIPNNKIIGLSKLPRLIEIYSERLQNQERLTKQIADTLNKVLQPKGVGLVIEAEHMCIKIRGVKKQNCKITTSSFTGQFVKDLKTREEFLRLMR